MKTMSMFNINVVGLIFGDLCSGGGAYIWNVVSVSICGGLILGGGLIFGGGAIFGMR